MHKKVAIIDIDGTISNPSHRLHYITQSPKNYDEFYNMAMKQEAAPMLHLKEYTTE